MCIAHRLSTIRNADNIIVLSRGAVVEQGTHSELLMSGHVYRDLVEAQYLTMGREITTEHVENLGVFGEKSPQIAERFPLAPSEPVAGPQRQQMDTTQESKERKYSNFELVKKVIG